MSVIGSTVFGPYAAGIYAINSAANGDWQSALLSIATQGIPGVEGLGGFNFGEHFARILEIPAGAIKDALVASVNDATSQLI